MGDESFLDSLVGPSTAISRPDDHDENLSVELLDSINEEPPRKRSRSSNKTANTTIFSARSLRVCRRDGVVATTSRGQRGVVSGSRHAGDKRVSTCAPSI